MPKRNRVDTSKSVEPSKEGPNRTCAQREGAPSVSPFTQNQERAVALFIDDAHKVPARGESRAALRQAAKRVMPLP